MGGFLRTNSDFRVVPGLFQVKIRSIGTAAAPPLLPHDLCAATSLLDRKLQSAVIVLPRGKKVVGLNYTVI